LNQPAGRRQDLVIATVLTLGMIDTAVAFGWLVVISFLAAHAVIWLRRPRVTTLLNRLSAAILTTFGVVTIASAE
jgi:threonine/homoserine/homoserine lactone efflux protein